MGYLTWRSLEILDKNFEPLATEKKFPIIAMLRSDCVDAGYALDAEGGGEESQKWYDENEDMIEFSLKYPNVIFKIACEGEESPDLYINYYYDGKMQTCAPDIIYPEPSHGKWSPPVEEDGEGVIMPKGTGG